MVNSYRGRGPTILIGELKVWSGLRLQRCRREAVFDGNIGMYVKLFQSNLILSYMIALSQHFCDCILFVLRWKSDPKIKAVAGVCGIRVTLIS